MADDTVRERSRATAIVRTRHDDPQVVARAIRPDNTPQMHTSVDGDRVVTRIERETTGGLHSTVDDYVVNLDVADRLSRRTARHAEVNDECGNSESASDESENSESDDESTTDTTGESTMQQTDDTRHNT